MTATVTLTHRTPSNVAFPQGRTDTSGHFERGLALSVQFLAQIGPSAELQPDFTHVGSFFDSLMSWYAPVVQDLIP